MKRVRKIILWIVGILAVLCIAILLICNQLVVNNAKGKVFNEIDSIKYRKVGLLLGTTPQARLTKATNYFFIYRIDAAEQLYKAGKIKKILISGDENSLDGINEPECMRDSLVARGVPRSAIILDGKGYRTINSVINANKVYGLKSFTIISQQFHNERALYLAEHLGLDVDNIQAYNAKNPNSRRALITYAREYLARVKMFWDLLTGDETESIVVLDSMDKIGEKDDINLPNDWQWHSDGSFRYPKSFKYEETFVEDVPANVEVYSKGGIQLCYWSLLGMWSTFEEFPEEGVWLSPTERVKNVTYKAESKGITSGFTHNGNIFYLKQKIIRGGEVNHSKVLVLINPPSMKDKVSSLTNEVANW